MLLTEGKTIVLEIVRVTSRSRITDVGEFALIVMRAEIKQPSWDYRVDYKVTMEEPSKQEGAEAIRQSCADKLNDRRTPRASRSCTGGGRGARCDDGKYRCLLDHLGKIDLGVAQWLYLSHLRGQHPGPHAGLIKPMRFDCSMKVGEGHRGLQHCKIGQVCGKRAAVAVGAKKEAMVRIALMALHNGCGLRVENILDHVIGIPPRDEKSLLGGSRNQGCRFCGHMGSSMDGASGHRCSARADPRQTG